MEDEKSNERGAAAPGNEPGENAVEQVLAGHPSARGKTGMDSVSGADNDPDLDRNTEPLWEVDPEDTSLAAGGPTEMTSDTAGGDAGTQTSGPGTGGTGSGGPAVSNTGGI